MSETLSFKREIAGDVVVLSVEGILDAGSSAEFRERCTRELNGEVSAMVLDVGDVPFVASSGLGTFLLLSEAGRTLGRRVFIVRTCNAVREVLSMMNIDRYLDLAEDVETALAELGAASPAG